MRIPNAFPYEGKVHGEAVTDEVETPRFATLATSSVCSASLRSQLPLIGEAFVRCGGESIPQSPSAPAPFTQGSLGVRAKKAFPS